ncbi:MAG: OmpA family protein, partial [Elusimicrobiota bacterium]
MNRVKRKSGVREMSDFSEWMLPYGNLMMILMIFFLMLYTFAYLGGTQFEEALTKIEATVLSAEQQRRMRKKLEEAQMATKLSDQLSKIAKVEINAQRIKIQLPSPVLFESASAELKNEAMSALHQIAKSIKVLPNEIIVEGHTDNVPISAGLKYKNNWELSAARAFSVVDYFV